MSNETDCVFCQIVAGSIPAHKLFEDDQTLAFLDVRPLAEGHVLVIPKRHCASLTDMSSEEVAATTRQFPRLARAVMAGTGAEGCNILENTGQAAGQEVPHVHWHIIPRRRGDGLGYRWNASAYSAGRDQQVLESLLSALRRLQD
jgi:histidine triad (HIT) family protein